jgi:hypothetical protein
MRWKTAPTILAALSVSATLTSTSAQGRDVSGQVFIVTQAHESVKLGLVPVSVYPRYAVQATIEAVDAALKSDRDEVEALATKIKEAHTSATALHDKLSKQLLNSLHDKQLSAAADRASNLERDILFLDKSASRGVSFFLGSAPYFRELNEHHRAVATTKSDADGKFMVSIPKEGEFAIVAYTGRETPNGHLEKYYWIVPAAEHVNLSNDNLTSTTTGTSLLHIRGDDDNADSTVTKEEIQRSWSEIQARYPDVFGTRLVTLTQDVLVRVPHGNVTLPAGTQLEVVSSDSSEVHVRYMNTEQVIPISAVDVR